MQLKWDLDAERRYLELNQESLTKNCQSLAALGATLFPIFSLLDYFTQHQQFQNLSLLRFSATLFFVVVYLLCRGKKVLNHPLAIITSLFAAASLSISLMCVELGGFASPYYAGINLIQLAAALILTVNARKMTLFVSLIVLLYVLLNALVPSAPIASSALINNLFFLLGTSVICVTAAFLTEKLRRQSYLRFLELERAYNFLKGEIESSQDSIQSMLQEISQRRVDLEKALVSAEEARKEAQAALSTREDFISLASHELNTPLTALKIQTDLALRRMVENPVTEHAGFYQKIVKIYDTQLKRLIHMVGDMLDVSRIKKGKLHLLKSQLNLGELVRDVVERTPHDQVKIHLEIAPDVVGSFDLFRMEQVVLNLLTNALKYGKKEPITVRVSRQGDNALLEVQDRGIGIKQNEQAKIFEQFERAVDPKDFTGLGLGLYISQQIVLAHEGQIEIESTLGEGSTFKVTLPLSTAI